jgi:hypothetical protein
MFGNFKTGGHVILAVKYTGYPLLLAKEKSVLQGMIGRFYGMEVNLEKIKVMKISRETSTVEIMISQRKLENVEYFKYLVNVITNDERYTLKIKSRIAIKKKQHSTGRRLFTSKLDSNLKNKLMKCYIRSIALCGAKTWTPEIRSEIPGKCLNVVLDKEGGDQGVCERTSLTCGNP